LAVVLIWQNLYHANDIHLDPERCICIRKFNYYGDSANKFTDCNNNNLQRVFRPHKIYNPINLIYISKKLSKIIDTQLHP
jgi:hypothetical protein